MSRRSFLAIALILFLSGALLATGEDQLISTEGNYAVVGGKEPVKITLEAGKLSIWRLRTNGGVSFRVTEGWKLYSDSTQFLWVYLGEKGIRKVDFHEGGIGVWGDRSPNNLLEQAPKQFREALPK